MSPAKSVRAKDLMQKDVVRLFASDPAERAIEVLEEYAISGAPVIDELGELVGVLSFRDVVRSEHIKDGQLETARSTYFYSDPLQGDGTEPFSQEDYNPELLGRELISDWMTPGVISVDPDATLKEICQKLTRERIHRVFVVDGKKLCGVISTFDIVQYLAGK